MKINELTLLVTFYNPTEKEINYWENFYSRNRSLLPIQFLVDGVDIKFNEEKVSKDDIFNYKVNNGKFKMTYNHIKDGNVKTKFFKPVDPDDFISEIALRKFKLPSVEAVVSYGARYTKDAFEDISQSYIEKAFKKAIKYVNKGPSYWTSFTLLPTRAILEDELYSGNRVGVIDDQIFGYICQLNGYPAYATKRPFYLYRWENGEYVNPSIMCEKLSEPIDEFEHILNRFVELGLESKVKFIREFNWPRTSFRYIDRMCNPEQINKDEYLKKIDNLTQTIKDINAKDIAQIDGSERKKYFIKYK